MQDADHAYNMTRFTLWVPFGKSEQMVWNCLLISKINRRILKGGASIVLVGVVDGVALHVAQIGGKIKRGVNLKLHGVWLHRLMSGTWSTAWKEKNTWKEIAIKRRGGWQEGTTETGERGKRKNQCVTVIWLLGKNSRVANCCCWCFRAVFFFFLFCFT